MKINGLSPYEKLYGKPLTQEAVTELKFNLLGYIRTLIEMDKQYQYWLEQKTLHANDNK